MMNRRVYRKPGQAYVNALLTMLITGTQALCSFGASTQQKTFDYHQLNVLGTSLDAQIVAGNKVEADEAMKAINTEIDKLKAILDTRDENSDLWKINHAEVAKPVKVAPEVIELLAAYDTWSFRTKRAFNGQIAEMIDLWRDAEKNNQLPDNDALLAAVEKAKNSGWKLDTKNNTVTRTSPREINVDALGKAFIIDRAVQAAHAQAPKVSGILLNIGGDICAWGDAATAKGSQWEIKVADPFRPAENAAPLATLCLRNLAVVTSGTYERFYTVQDKKYSHIIDPRSGKTADQIQSVTVIARDVPTANALSTAISVLGTEEGLALLKTIEHAECLIVTNDGKQIRSDGFGRFETTWPTASNGHPTLWPEKHEVRVDFIVKPHPTKATLFPYVAVWAEDGDGRIVRTVELWAHPKKLRYLRDLEAWWKFGRRIKQVAQVVTRATRPAGKYSVVWDGLDAQGNPLPPGDYKVCLEVSYEDGDDKTEKVQISCKEDETHMSMTETSTFVNAEVIYGKIGK